MKVMTEKYKPWEAAYSWKQLKRRTYEAQFAIKKYTLNILGED